MKEFLGGKEMATDEVVKGTVTDWSNGLAADFYNKGIVNLTQRLDRCLSHNGETMQKNIHICIY
jgi:hypothetical protein